VILTPNRSRIRSDNPFPVTTPIRALISWTIIKASMIGTSDHRREYPKWAPAME